MASSPSIQFLSVKIFAKHRTDSWYANVNKRHITQTTRSYSHIRYILSMNDKLYRLRCRTVYSENNPTHISPTVISHMSILLLTQITFAASMNNFIVGIWKLSKCTLVGLRPDSSKYWICDTLLTGKEQPKLLVNCFIITRTRKYIKLHYQLP